MSACPVRSCPREIARSNHPMCHEHWNLVPLVLQKTIWRLWHDGRPFDGYAEAVENAVEQVNARVGKYRGGDRT